MSPVQLHRLNGIKVEYARDSTIADLFSQQAVQTASRTAVVFRDRTLNYRQLDERSNRLARHLQSLGVKPETLVGVAMGRSETVIVSILAILKAGGAYVPLDPNYPAERISWIIENSGVSILLTTAETRQRLLFDSARPIIVDAEDPAIALQNPQSVPSIAAASNLAYVIYTSGSTGKPKGVMIEHRNVVNFFAGMDIAIGCEPNVWLAVTSISFDISVLELLWTLTRGFTVVIHPDGEFDTVGEQILRHHVSHLQMTPSLARILTLDPHAFAALSSLKQVLLGGEEVPASLISRLREVFAGEIHNMYGPTETTVWSTTCRVEDVGATVSIGQPIANTEIYLLDADMNTVPMGEIGEVFIGGDGVARGYWNRIDLTAERFLTIRSISDKTLYRTGDLARYQPDGNIEFLGRADYQIKLRGHRIEPGEIEAVLEQCAGVRQAAVISREDREGDKRLVAYLVGETGEFDAVGALRTAIAAKLPDYMIPSNFVFLPALPLTDNGKTDRKALHNLPPPDHLAVDMPKRETETAT